MSASVGLRKPRPLLGQLLVGRSSDALAKPERSTGIPLPTVESRSDLVRKLGAAHDEIRKLQSALKLTQEKGNLISQKLHELDLQHVELCRDYETLSKNREMTSAMLEVYRDAHSEALLEIEKFRQQLAIAQSNLRAEKADRETDRTYSQDEAVKIRKELEQRDAEVQRLRDELAVKLENDRALADCQRERDKALAAARDAIAQRDELQRNLESAHEQASYDQKVIDALHAELKKYEAQ